MEYATSYLNFWGGDQSIGVVEGEPSAPKGDGGCNEVNNNWGDFIELENPYNP